MELKFATYFLAIARYKNLSKAAEALFVTQSTLSQFLEREEKEMGVRLADRSRNGLTLTYAGRLYEESCRNMLEHERSLRRKMTDISKSNTGSVEVGITPQWGGNMLSEIYPYFKLQYPNYLVKLHEDTTNPLLEKVASGDLDLAILATMRDASIRQENTVICREELVLAVPVSIAADKLGGASHAAGITVLPQADLKALRSENYIVSCVGTAIRDITNRMFLENHIEPAVICEINNHAASLKMVASGLGIAIIPCNYIERNPRIRYYSVGKGLYWDIRVVRRKGYALSTPDQYLIELITGWYRERKRTHGSSGSGYEVSS